MNQIGSKKKQKTMKHIETSFRTFLNYKLNERKKSSTQDEPEDQEPIIEEPDEDQNQDEEEGIDKLITEYQDLMKEWKDKQKKRLDDILQG